MHGRRAGDHFANQIVGQQSQLHHIDDDRRELSTWTRSQMVMHCRTMFKQAIRWDMTSENPFAETEKPKTATKKWHHIRSAEYLRLMEAAPDIRRRCLYAALYTTGIRIGEAFSLTWSDIDFERSELRVQNRAETKTVPPFLLKAHERRTIPLTKHTLIMLAEYPAQAPEGVPHIFLSAERYKLGQIDRKWENEFMDNNSNRDFKNHCRRAQIVLQGKRSIHTLRKSAGQNWALAGVPIRTLQYLMGHSNERTTPKFYAQMDPASAAQAVNATDAMLDAAAAQADSKPNETDAHLTREGVMGPESVMEQERP